MLLCCAVAAATWLAFYPTVFSRDAFYMLLSAVEGKYNDIHALLIPLAVAAVLRMGGDIGLVTLAQVLFGFLGIRRLVLALSRLLGVVDARKAELGVFVVVAALASPLSPLPIYLATLWSDTWLAVFLLWWLRLVIELQQGYTARWGTAWRLTLVLLLTALILLVRYNDIVLYPIMAALLAIALGRSVPRRTIRYGALLLPLLAAAAFLSGAYALIDIGRGHAEHAVYALDLASMMLRAPTICQDLSLHTCEIVLGEFPPGFRAGDGAISLTFSQSRLQQLQPFMELFFHPRLEEDFSIAARDHPGLLFQVKLLNFLDYIGPDRSQFFFQNTIIPQDIRFLPGQAFADPAASWFMAVRRVHQSPWLSWLSFVHAVWLLPCVIGVIALGVRLAIRRAASDAFWLGLLCVPASYYGSHIIALTTLEFRFMYPSTLLMQVGTITALAWLLTGRRVKRPAYRRI